MKEEICPVTNRKHKFYANFPWECADCLYRREIMGIKKGYVGYPYELPCENCGYIKGEKLSDVPKTTPNTTKGE
jgi:hypothetical protein